MKHLTLSMIALLVFVSLLSVPAALAGDTYDDDLDPEANACFEGGTLAGKCETEADWEAGWFLVRYEHGLIDLDKFPSEYRWVLPRDQGNHNDDDHDDDNDHDSGQDDEICDEPLEPVFDHEA